MQGNPDFHFLTGFSFFYPEFYLTRISSHTFGNAGSVSVFETTIRELGGLLSAYDLSKDRVFLDKALELGGMLANAFNTASGLPLSAVDLRTRKASGGWSGGAAILSELYNFLLFFR